MNVFNFLRSRKNNHKDNYHISATDISQPFDFRVEMHIEPNSSVEQMMAFTNCNSLHFRPNMLTPDPKWSSVERRWQTGRTPLAEDELKRSPFGRYLPSPHRRAIQRKYGVADVPTIPIPRAPNRYRESIPLQWMDPQGIEKHLAVHRNHSKSLAELKVCEEPVTFSTSSRCSCEVCKKGTVTNSLYFPTAALRTLKVRSQSQGRANVEEDPYDEIHSRNSHIDVQLPFTRSVGRAANLSIAMAGHVTKPVKRPPTPPSPPPRIKSDNLNQHKGLGFSPVRTVSSTEWPSFDGLLPRQSKSGCDETLECDSSRPSMDSGINDEQSDAEEALVTRL